MKNKLRNLWEKIKNPPLWAYILTFFLCLASAVGALCMLLVDYEGNALAIIAYSLFALAAITLSYSVYLLVRFAPKVKHTIIRFMEKYDFTYLLLRNYGFRTIVFSIGSFCMSIAFAAFNAYMGIVYLSIWYGALAAYYVFLAFFRGGILWYHKGRIGKKKALRFESEELRRAQLYRNCGIVLLVLNTALSSAIAQMIFEDRFFSYGEYLVIAYATYAFYKVTMSIVNLFKARRHEDMTVQAIRNINLTDALVSILALQTALLHTFQDGTVDISVFNTFTGLLVSVTTIALGIFMIVKGQKNMKKIQSEKIHGKQI